MYVGVYVGGLISVQGQRSQAYIAICAPFVVLYSVYLDLLLLLPQQQCLLQTEHKPSAGAVAALLADDIDFLQ
jgi:hypothetical protein